MPFDPIQAVRLRLRARRHLKRGDPELKALRELVDPARTAVDVGANRGVYTCLLARVAARVEAFEANPTLADRLARSGLTNVRVHALGLSDAAGRADLTVPPHRRGGQDDPSGHLRGNGPGERVSVELAPLDALGLTNVGFIKIDVEGHEERVLDGAWATIARDRPALLVELEERMNPGGLARTEARLANIGYVARYLDAGTWHPLDTLGEDQRTPGGRYVNNFLFRPA